LENVTSEKGKILVIRGGAIGDFILTLPAIQALRVQFPSSQIDVLGYPHIVQLAVAGGLVHRATAIEARPLAGFFARGSELSADLADYFSEFDLIISYLYDPDAIFRTNVARCSMAQFIQGPHRPDDRSRIHASQVFLKPLERLAIFEPDATPRLKLPGEGPGRKELALHPGSGSDRKNWPEEQWASLLERLVSQTQTNLLLVGGEAEGERLQRLSATLPPHRLRIAQSLALSRLGQVLQTCVGFVGHDSGISHLAAALGLAGVVLWGETAQEVWRPRSEQFQVLQEPHGLKELEVKTVFEAVVRLIG